VSAQEIITRHLDLWTSAISHKSTAGRGTNGKIELTGIKKLRELILELAVRGKLVPQVPTDEQAETIIKGIEQAYTSRPEGKQVKVHSSTDNIEAPNEPFEIPGKWKWVQLKAIGTIGSSSRVHQKDWKKAGVPFYRAREIVQLSKHGHVEDDLFISEELYSSLTRKGLVPETNDIMITGVGTIGIPYVVGANDRFYFKDASVLIFKNIFKLNPLYLRLFFLSPSWQQSIHEYSMGTTVHTLTISRAGATLVPLPPYSEQQRIVEKVEELMALCDRLEQQSSDQITAHETLVDALLDTLTQSRDATELADNWARLAAHFDTLFTTEHSIERLKQTILQFAVMGKLVVQNPNEESASVLLEKISEEKRRLVKEGKIKNPKELGAPGNETPYPVPRGWQWEKLGNFTLVGTGATPSRDRADYYSPPEHPWVTSGETDQDYIFETKERVSSLAVKETNITIYPAGTLVVAMYGQGKTRGQISELKVAAGTNQACAAIRPLNKELHHRRYIKLCFVKLYDEIRDGAAGGAQPNLNTGKIANTLIPLPPLQEQHRIVKKVDELMALCDQLKARLSKASETRLRLAETVTEQAIGNGVLNG